MGGKVMFRRAKIVKEIIEIQIFSLAIAAAIIVNTKTIYDDGSKIQHRKEKDENSSERDALW